MGVDPKPPYVTASSLAGVWFLVTLTQCAPLISTPQPQFLSPYLYAPSSNVNFNYPQPGPLVPYGASGAGAAGFYGDETIQFIPAEAFAPHPFSRIPKRMNAEPFPMQATVTGPIKLTDARPKPAQALKQSKRVMNAPFIQAIQQSNDKFRIQKLELGPAKLRKIVTAKAQPFTILKIQAAPEKSLLKVQPTPAKSVVLKMVPKVQPVPAKLRAASPDQQVVVTATSKTAADQPIVNIPVIATGVASYPFFGLPKTNNESETSLILEPSSKAISGNGGTAISTPVSHAILRHGSSTKILFRPQSVAIVGANGRAHAQADLIVDYID